MENEADCFLKKTPILYSIPVFTSTYKNMKNFVSEIFKRTRSGKLDAEEASHIELCGNQSIQDKYNLITKTSPVDYADVLLIDRNYRVITLFSPW